MNGDNHVSDFGTLKAWEPVPKIPARVPRVPTGPGTGHSKQRVESPIEPANFIIQPPQGNKQGWGKERTPAGYRKHLSTRVYVGVRFAGPNPDRIQCWGRLEPSRCLIPTRGASERKTEINHHVYDISSQSRFRCPYRPDVHQPGRYPGSAAYGREYPGRDA